MTIAESGPLRTAHRGFDRTYSMNFVSINRRTTGPSSSRSFLRSSVVLAAIRLALICVLLAAGNHFDRPLVVYEDLGYYRDLGGSLLSWFGGRDIDVPFVANPLWALISVPLSGLPAIVVAALALLAGVIRDALWLDLFGSVHANLRRLQLALIGVAPYLFVYSFNLTSDSLAALLFAVVVFTLVRREQQDLPQSAIAILLLGTLPLVRIQYAVVSMLILYRFGYYAGRGHRQPRIILAAIAASILALGAVLLAVQYGRAYAASSTSFAWSFGRLQPALQSVLDTSHVLLQRVAYQVVHGFAFLFVREQVYLSGFSSATDYVVTGLQLLLILPGLALVVRRRVWIVILALALVYVPTIIGVTHARYSLAIQPVLVISTATAVWRLVPRLIRDARRLARSTRQVRSLRHLWQNFRRFVVYGSVGIATVATYLGGLLAFSRFLPRFDGDVSVAYSAAVLVNYLLHRHITFSDTKTRIGLREIARFGATVTITATLVQVMENLFSAWWRSTEGLAPALAAAFVVAPVGYLLMRRWVFHRTATEENGNDERSSSGVHS